MKKVIVITGPTASGKSSIAIETAKKINGEIIGADSIQIYKNLDIGSAKPYKQEMQNVKHYMIDILCPNEKYSVAKFKMDGEECISSIKDKGKTPVITGGTGLYIDALVKNIDFNHKTSPSATRKKFNKLLNEKGKEYLHGMLCTQDPQAGKTIHPNNTKRVIRYLEILEIHSGTIKEYQQKAASKPPKWDYSIFVLKPDRDFLYKRINCRVDEMIKKGLIDEVRQLLVSGLDRNAQSLQGIGYKETVMFLDGLITKEEFVRILKRNTRRYAKRQYTWFARYKDACFIDVNENTNITEVADFISKTYKK